MSYMISKYIEIDAAHRVPLHESKCKNLHGHRYKVQANIIAQELGTGVQDGMVLDYSFVKQLLTDSVDRLCDHGLILSIEDMAMLNMVLAFPKDAIPELKYDIQTNGYWTGLSLSGKTLVIPYVPTAENLARFFFDLLQEPVTTLSKDRASLHSITIWETPTSEATYPFKTAV